MSIAEFECSWSPSGAVMENWHIYLVVRYEILEHRDPDDPVSAQVKLIFVDGRQSSWGPDTNLFLHRTGYTGPVSEKPIRPELTTEEQLLVTTLEYPGSADSDSLDEPDPADGLFPGDKEYLEFVRGTVDDADLIPLGDTGYAVRILVSRPMCAAWFSFHRTETKEREALLKVGVPLWGVTAESPVPTVNLTWEGKGELNIAHQVN